MLSTAHSIVPCKGTGKAWWEFFSSYCGCYKIALALTSGWGHNLAFLGEIKYLHHGMYGEEDRYARRGRNSTPDQSLKAWVHRWLLSS